MGIPINSQSFTYLHTHTTTAHYNYQPEENYLLHKRKPYE